MHLLASAYETEDLLMTLAAKIASQKVLHVNRQDLPWSYLPWSEDHQVVN